MEWIKRIETDDWITIIAPESSQWQDFTTRLSGEWIDVGVTPDHDDEIQSTSVWHARCRDSKVPGAELHPFGWRIPADSLILWTLPADQGRRLEHLDAGTRCGASDAMPPHGAGGHP